MEIRTSYLLDHCKRARFLCMVPEYDSFASAFPSSAGPVESYTASNIEATRRRVPSQLQRKSQQLKDIDMTIDREILRPSHADSGLSAERRRMKKMVAISLASLVCCVSVGPTACTNGVGQSSIGSFGPTGGQITAAAIGVGAVVVGTVVLIEVHHSHHTVKGCVFSGQNGIEVQTQGGMETYALAGETANIKVGDLVRFHGTKGKKVKGSAGNPTFSVEKVSRDYGPCKLISGHPANAPVAR